MHTTTPSSNPPAQAWLGRASAALALARVLPWIERQLQDPLVSGTGYLHLVAMDPALPAGLAAFEDAVLLEHSIGERSRWDADYAGFARAKARLSWEHRLDGHALVTQRPHWLRPGDTLLWGGAWLDGIAVGVSGAQPWYDEAFGLCIAAALRAEAKRLADGLVQARCLSVPQHRQDLPSG